MRPHYLITTLLAIAVSTSGFSQAKSQPTSLATLKQGQVINGFAVKTLYLNAVDKPMGVRLVHAKTGFMLDLLQIESVPQAFIWAGTRPVSDKGEPHTQEHLLITKGNKGHDLNTREGMSLAVSNAFTEQLHTVYDFYTGAGADVFYKLFDQYMDALLYPDYTSEEVKREVRNWGVSQNADKTLKLEEKGTVYYEMSSSMNNPGYILYNELNRELYGTHHPLSYNAGGLPSGIREMTPKDISTYHEANYYLGNMGAIISVPNKMSLSSVLQRMNGILLSLDKPSQHNYTAKGPLPAPQGATPGEIRTIKVPLDDVNQPGDMILAYPADLKLSVLENMELSYFMQIFAGDATTNLYKLLVDSKTHIPGFAAQSVSSGVSNDQGNPISLQLTGIKPEDLTPAKAEEVRKVILAELQKIAAWPDHSPELLEFNKRYDINITAAEKYYNKFINTPPQFGYRNTYDSWYQQLDFLAQEPGFKKSIIFKPQDEAIRKKLATGTNIWRKMLNKYGLLTKKPYVLMTQADPSLAKKAEDERQARVNAELERLKQVYKTTNDQEAIAQYQKAYDENTAQLEKGERSHHIGFIRNPPLTLDDQLNYHQVKLAGNVPAVVSVFDNMASATTGIAFDLHGVPADKLKYLALLPQLLTTTGVVRDGKPVSYPDMLQQTQQQILSLTSYYSTNATTGRAELVVRSSGGNEKESIKAVQWMDEIMQHPNWTMGNLPRIRDLVSQRWSAIRKTMQNSEESWVSDPTQSYLAQNQPLYLSTNSFITRTFNIFRLKWMLKEISSTSKAGLTDLLLALGNTKANRAELTTLLGGINSGKLASADATGKAYAQLDDADKKLAAEAASDLVQLLNDIPDNSLESDWKMLCETIRTGLTQGPEKTLDELNQLRAQIFNKGNARVFIIGSAATTKQLSADLITVIGRFDTQPVAKQQYSTDKMIDQRLLERMHTDQPPVYVGLINPNSATGVMTNSTPFVTYQDTTKEKLLQLLAAGLYGGAGKESVYTKSTGAGLSYGGGVRASTTTGRFSYYAERTPELPQTLSFVITEIKKAPVDPEVTDYVIAGAIGFVRSSDAYEARGEAMARDLADGYTDNVVKSFRKAVLKLWDTPDLAKQIYAQKDAVYEKILPGYGKPGNVKPGSNFFVIGPEKQMAAYEGYLKRVESAETTLYRLYPRDFWITY